MDNFTKLGNTSANNEREKVDVKHINEFLDKTSTITKNSTSMQICSLIAEITNFQLYNTSMFQDILTDLHHLLSDCISCKYNLTDDGFIKLNNYIEEKRALLKELNFT